MAKPAPNPPLTFSQIINESVEFDLEELDMIFGDTKKRKSDENVLNEDNDYTFAQPNPTKKRRDTESSQRLNEELASGTQSFLLNCSFSTNQLTQPSDCVQDDNYEGNFSAPIVNDVTCSQYIQKELDSFSDDSLNELFKHLDENETNLNRTIKIIEEPSKPAKTSNETVNWDSCLRPVSTSPFCTLGSFYGLTSHHKKFILKTKNIQSLYDWQEECLRLKAVHNKSNLIYALPTSGGKTLVAEIVMLREIILRKKNVIFVLPYVSIVQEKVQDLMPFASEFNFLVEEYCAGKGSIPPVKRRKKNVIYVCTIEKSQILFDSLQENNRLQEVGLIVVDELHMVGDPHRGYSLEILLAKTLYTKKFIQIVGMSATISNLRQIATFLKADIYVRDFRPVELTEFVKIGSEILSINPKSRSMSEAFKFERRIRDDISPQMLKRDPDHIAALVLETVPKASCLVFCATKQNCENVALLLAETLPSQFKEIYREDKINLIAAIKADSNGHICPVLVKTIPYGVAYHNSSLTSDERRHVEDAFRLNILCVICCTSTLAAGVNLPAQRVIIRSPYVGKQFLTLTRYKQMVGRAGRAGKCETGESIMLCDPKDNEKLTTLLCSKMDETQSAFLEEKPGQILQTVILNLLGVKLAQSIDDLVQFFKHSLLYIQLHRADNIIRERIAESVKLLMQEGAVSAVKATDGSRYSSFEITVDGVVREVHPDDHIAVSKIGQAAVNAGISLEEAKQLESDLRKLNDNFVMAQHLHLFFIVAPMDIVDSINFDNSLVNDIFMQLEPSLLHTAKAIGITESLAMKLVTRPSAVKQSDKDLIKRFFVALTLFELFNSKTVYDVARKYKINRGVASSLMSSASSRCYSVFKFCEVHEEFSIFKDVLEKFSKRMAYCCSEELLPLMELPCVKIGRAKMLFAAGLKKADDIARLTPKELIEAVKQVNLRQAEQIIKAAKASMMENIENYLERVEEMKETVGVFKKKY